MVAVVLSERIVSALGQVRFRADTCHIVQPDLLISCADSESS